MSQDDGVEGDRPRYREFFLGEQGDVPIQKETAPELQVFRE